MNPEIEDREVLYRAIIPQFWHPTENRITSATFKDSKGVSVDREGDRDTPQLIAVFKERFKDKLVAIISLTAKQCRDLETCPEADPQPDNEFHALILDNGRSYPIKSKAKHDALCQASQLVFKNQ